MINLDLLSIDPKQMPSWISKKYRRFLRDNAYCMTCGTPLLDEKPDYTSHHHRHSGGQYANDAMLVSLCLGCHNAFHANEVGFKRDNNLDDKAWHRNMAFNLTAYILAHDKAYELINALGMIARSCEDK